MNITWIIGNGFDINIGLNTGYKYFLDNVYFSESEEKYCSEKKRLIQAAKELDWNKKNDRWSDLELFSGQVTAGYEAQETELFLAGFQEMLNELRDHLQREQTRFSRDLFDRADIDEFWKSITRLPERVCPVGVDVVGNYREMNERVGYNFISLNYTEVFDHLLDAAKKAHSNFDTRFSKVDIAHSVLHIHGTLSENGEIVFCVNDPSQIENQDFAQNSDFLELWLKRNRNTFFGNHKVKIVEDTINRSNLIVIFGCSYGETDEYIWEMLRVWLGKNEKRRLLVLDHDVPPVGSPDLYKSQQAKRLVRERLMGSLSDSEGLARQIWIENSGTVFRDLIMDKDSEPVAATYTLS